MAAKEQSSVPPSQTTPAAPPTAPAPPAQTSPGPPAPVFPTIPFPTALAPAAGPLHPAFAQAAGGQPRVQAPHSTSFAQLVSSLPRPQQAYEALTAIVLTAGLRAAKHRQDLCDILARCEYFNRDGDHDSSDYDEFQETMNAIKESVLQYRAEGTESERQIAALQALLDPLQKHRALLDTIAKKIAESSAPDEQAIAIVDLLL